MRLSIVIRCSDDTKLLKCLKSIDTDDIELIVVLLKPTREVKNIVKRFNNIICYETNSENLSLAQNIGIERASYEKVLLMDSDCIFGPGSIELIYQALKSHRVVKGRVAYRWTNRISRIVSQVRTYTTSYEPRTLTPLLAFSKDIKEEIGGFYFNEQIPWVEDGELHNRIQKAGIEIKYLSNAIAYHIPLSFLRDLKGAYRFGVGQRIAEKKGSLSSHVLSQIMSPVTSFPKVYDHQGFCVAMYFSLLWQPILNTGYFIQMLRENLINLT